MERRRQPLLNRPTFTTLFSSTEHGLTAQSYLMMQTLVVWHKDKWLSPAMEAFLSLLRDRLVSKDPKQAVALSA
jgi:hypothetical protein